MNRLTLLHLLAEQINQVKALHPVRVAIDGPDAAGKTTLADELAAVLAKTDRQVIRASIDGFHQPRSVRYSRGSLSPHGYYRDSFDYPALISNLLVPLGPNGTRRYRAAVFHHLADQPVYQPERVAFGDAVLLFDGIFLLKPFLAPCWEFSIYLRVTPETALERALLRDADLLGGPDQVRLRYWERYLPAQKLYLAECRPQSAACLVVDNEDPQVPFVVRETRDEDSKVPETGTAQSSSSTGSRSTGA